MSCNMSFCNVTLKFALKLAHRHCPIECGGLGLAVSQPRFRRDLAEGLDWGPYPTSGLTRRKICRDLAEGLDGRLGARRGGNVWETSAHNHFRVLVWLASPTFNYPSMNRTGLGTAFWTMLIFYILLGYSHNLKTPQKCVC